MPEKRHTDARRALPAVPTHAMMPMLLSCVGRPAAQALKKKEQVLPTTKVAWPQSNAQPALRSMFEGDLYIVVVCVCVCVCVSSV